MHRALNRLLTTTMTLAFAALAGVTMTPSHALANVAPVLTVPGSQTVNEGALLSFAVSATDADGQPVSLRAAGLPTGATFRDNHNNTGSFSWTPDFTQSGTYGPTFIADDTFGGVTSKGVPITVQNVNQAPVLDPIGDRQVERGSTMSIFISGSDPDNDPLTYATQNMPSYASFQDFGDGTGQLTLAPPLNMAPATTSMTVSLSDGSLTASETFSIQVYSVGSTNPPVLAPIGNQTVAEGATAQVPVSATDADGDPMTWSVSLPGFASFASTGSGPGAASGTITLAPGFCASGTYAASMGVSDGGMSDSENFTITVTDVNRAPQWVVPQGGYTLTLNEGGSADLSVHASDPDQACGTPAPLLVYPGGPAALTVTVTDQGSGTGTLHVAAGFDAAGTYSLTLRARDAMNAAVTTDVSVSVTVVNTNRAPVASAGGPYSCLVGTAMSMDGSASSDPDGDALTYSWSFGDGGTGDGATPSHAYAAAGHYTVWLTVSDGSLSGNDSTTADARTGFLARAFTDHAKIMLKTGKPKETVYLEPLGGSFAVTSVDVSSLRLSSSDGLGSVPYITPIDGSVVVGLDSDRNHVPEVAMDFAKDDLRSLFTNLDNDTQESLVLSANMLGGGSVRAVLAWLVQPEKKLVARIQPNPMNPVATVRVNLERDETLSIRFYDMRGRLVRTLLEGVDTPAGVHDYLFDGHGVDGRTLPTGQYFYRAETPTAKTSGTVMILK